MKRIDVTIKNSSDDSGRAVDSSWTFRTNSRGNYLFVGTGENRQISCDHGYGDNRKTRKEIREYLKDFYGYGCELKKLSYKFN